MIESKLYSEALEPKEGKYKDKLALLNLTLSRVEDIVNDYLKNIQNDFPQLTDHSIQHSTKLWHYADIIVGDKPNYLTPVEAFVLHVVFLIHDAGMCYSTLNNKSEIEKDIIYTDFISRRGSTVEVKEEALFFTVRARHGAYALRIAVERLSNGEYLIENEQIREELGLFIGKIAKSHTENINYIEREFPTIYTIPSLPVGWTLNCQKLAFLLRTSDAAHLDNLRTPKSSKIISEMSGVSGQHWTFQKKIGFPSVSQDGLLIYSTNSPFKISEQKAWWYCYDALLVLDRELKNANEFFNSVSQLGFETIGVKSINDTLTLGRRFLRTDGWDSLNTTIKVSNPIHIAAELGGKKLYGNISYAIREIIQNSVDAIHLFRIETSQDDLGIGKISISLSFNNDIYELIISDDGIGMSENLITNELLDFGGSYWKSNRFNYEFEGLRSKGFDSIGKFGIGFFSIFMLGNNVQVTSWKFGEGIEKIRTLDFYDGLYSNPIFRRPTEDEKKRIITRGTSIKVQLEVDPNEKDGVLRCNGFKDSTLYNIVRHFAPFIDININGTELDGTNWTFNPIDAIEFEALDLVEHMCVPTDNNFVTGLLKRYVNYKLPLDDIIISGKIFGRLALRLYDDDVNSAATGIVVSKGIRVHALEGLIGFLFIDEVVSVKRDDFLGLVPYQILKDWAKKQINFITNNSLEDYYSSNYYALIIAFNLQDKNTPICLTKTNNTYKWCSINEFTKFAIDNNDVKIFQEGFVPIFRASNVDGFIAMHIRMSMDKIVDKIDKGKIFSVKDRIEIILKEVWGNYEFSTLDYWKETKGLLERPYHTVDVYSKSVKV